jgi:hypothetical protein
LKKGTKAGDRKHLAKAGENSLHKSKEFVIPSATEESPFGLVSSAGILPAVACRGPRQASFWERVPRSQANESRRVAAETAALQSAES